MSTRYSPSCTASRLFAATSAVAVTCAIFLSVVSGMTDDLTTAVVKSPEHATAVPCVLVGKAA